MTPKPCLIFNNYQLKLTDGGPSGFLAHNLEGAAGVHWRLGPLSVAGGQHSYLSRLRKALRRYESKIALRATGLPKGAWLRAQVLSARNSFRTERAAEYPWVWFHDVYSMSACRDLLRDDQNVILQPHCPERPSEEVVSFGGAVEDVGWMRAAESFAFGRANVVVLPNEYVRPIYASLLQPGTRVEYLMSGCREPAVRYRMPLDPELVFFLFLGRRMDIKGFDIVLEAFGRAHRSDARLRLLLTGSGERVSMSGVIDVGSTPDPGAWLASCDYLVSANRFSYLDLSLMEALAIGTPSIVCCTGGHRQFLDTPSAGITTLLAPEPEALSVVMLACRLKRSENRNAVAENQRLFTSLFSPDLYRARLETLLFRLFGSPSAERRATIG